jgi:CyaY protein
MTDPEFMDQAERVLQAIETCCDRMNDETDVDIDNQRVGGMITLVFANQSQIVVNLQKPLHEIWLAARSGGYHYKFDSKQWSNTKGNAENRSEFYSDLSKYASQQAGMAVVFSA